jgi:hypothetical protein
MLLCSLYFVISPAYAQVDREKKGASSKMGPMMHSHGFEQYDSMFEGFRSKTFKKVSDTFGVPVEDAISDLGLPEDMDGLRFWRFKSSMGRPGNCQLHGHEHAPDALLSNFK